jgi:hypothetical protein
MRKRLIVLMMVLAVLLFISLTRPTHAGQGAAGSSVSTTPAFDRRDFSGIWSRVGGDRGFGPPRSIPALTEAGKAAASRQTSPGRSRLPDIIKNVESQESSSDPAFKCNPMGFPRILLDIAFDYHEWHHLRDRMLQIIQESRVLREIWMDGRELPTAEAIENLGPTWYGYSVGRWEGNTLVVTTVGLDDRALLDSFLLPKSPNARIEERYTLADPNTLELQLTMWDPDYYTQTWVSDVKRWRRELREKITFYGWYGMFSGVGELICAPMNAGGANPLGGN